MLSGVSVCMVPSWGQNANKETRVLWRLLGRAQGGASREPVGRLVEGGDLGVQPGQRVCDTCGGGEAETGRGAGASAPCDQASRAGREVGGGPLKEGRLDVREGLSGSES